MYRFPMRIMLPLLLGVFGITIALISYMISVNSTMDMVEAEYEKDIKIKLSRAQGVIELELRKGRISDIQRFISSFGTDYSHLSMVLGNSEGIIIAATRLDLVGQKWDHPKFDNYHTPDNSSKKNWGIFTRLSDDKSEIFAITLICSFQHNSEPQDKSCGFLTLRESLLIDKGIALGVLRKQAIYTGTGILLATLALMFYFYRLLTLRMHKLLEVTSDFSAGKFQSRADLKGQDELAMIGQSMDAMLSKISRSQLNLTKALNDLEVQKYILDNHALVIVTDRMSIITFANEKFCQASGYTKEELVGQYSRSHVSPVHSPAFFDEMWKTLTSGNVWHGEICGLNKQGKEFWLDATRAPIYDDYGNIERYITIFTEITESKLAQIALRENEILFRRITENIDQVMVIYDVESLKYSYLSPAFDKIFGPSRDGRFIRPEYTQDLIEHWIHPDDQKSNRGIVSKGVRADPNSYYVEARLIRHDGSIRWISSQAYPEVNIEGDIINIIGVFTDITYRKLLENQLRQSNKMEAMGKLTGGIAHDFNNILGIIMGNLDIMRQMIMDKPDVLLRLEKACKGVERGAGLTKKLLGFTRKKSYETKMISINDFIGTLRELISRSLTATITVKTSLAENLWPVNIDPGDFEDALLNLALNARDAMPEGGTLFIETANVILDGKYTDGHPSSQKGEYVMISVSDTGEGMPPQTQEKILEPFFTTKEGDKGTGLGLSMVHGFVQRTGGHMRIYSELAKGSVFRIYIPRATDTGDLAMDGEDIEDVLSRGDETILVVDDEQSLCELAEIHLAGLGYVVVAARNSDDALKILRSPQNINLLFSDIVMPGQMDGYQLAQAAREIRPSLKILLTSGFTQNREKYLKKGNDIFSQLARNILNKPYNQVELSQAIRKILDKAAEDFAPDEEI